MTSLLMSLITIMSKRLRLYISNTCCGIVEGFSSYTNLAKNPSRQVRLSEKRANIRVGLAKACVQCKFFNFVHLFFEKKWFD